MAMASACCAASAAFGSPSAARTRETYTSSGMTVTCPSATDPMRSARPALAASKSFSVMSVWARVASRPRKNTTTKVAMNTKYKAILRVLSFVLVASFVVNNVFVSLIVSQSRLAPGPAPALNRLLAIRVVVVGELLAGRNVARGADPDRLADDVAVAVRLARVVDEARQVAADVGVTHPSPIDG